MISRLRNPAARGGFGGRVVALLAERSAKTMQLVISSGVDNVLIKPLVPDKIRAQLLQVMRDQQPYLTFDGYVGPDRRRLPKQLEYSGAERRG